MKYTPRAGCQSHDVIAEHLLEQVQSVQGKYQTSILDVKNATLGCKYLAPSMIKLGPDLTYLFQFAKVFVVRMPERTDKRDSVALAASFLSIDFEWADAVRRAEIPSRALPLVSEISIYYEGG